MAQTTAKRLTQEIVWEKVLPMIKNESEKLVQVMFGRYKMAYQLIKRRIVDQVGELDRCPSLSNQALKSGYTRIEQKEKALTETLKADLSTLRDLKQACTVQHQPRCKLIIDEARKSVLEIQSYMVYHNPKLKKIAHEVKNLSNHVPTSSSTPSISENHS